jgi:hypothetical protein
MRFAAVGLTFFCGLLALAAETPVVVTDAEGKEIKLAAARLTLGTRRLTWLADPKGATPDAKLGPLAVEFREPNSTGFQNGVVTLVPATAIESVKYDAAKQAMTVKVAGLPEPLTGSTAFKGMNALGVETGDPAAATKYAGGSVKGGVQGFAFPEAKPFERKPLTGGTWHLTIDQPKASNPVVPVTGLRFLVATGKGEALLTALPAKKGPALDLAAGTPFEVVAVDLTRKVAVVEVAKDDTRTLTLSPDADGKPGSVVGLLGEIPAGWKLFPLHTLLKVEKAKE